MKMMLLNQIIAAEQSLEDMENNNQTSKTKPYVLGEVKGGSFEMRKYSTRIFIKERIFKKYT